MLLLKLGPLLNKQGYFITYGRVDESNLIIIPNVKFVTVYFANGHHWCRSVEVVQNLK